MKLLYKIYINGTSITLACSKKAPCSFDALLMKFLAFQTPPRVVVAVPKYRLVQVAIAVPQRCNGFQRWKSCNVGSPNLAGGNAKNTHTIHLWYIYLHLVDFYGKCSKCREICHTWMLWDMYKTKTCFPKLSPLSLCFNSRRFFAYIHVCPTWSCCHTHTVLYAANLGGSSWDRFVIMSQLKWDLNKLLMVQKSQTTNHLGCKKKPINNGRNYQTLQINGIISRYRSLNWCVSFPDLFPWTIWVPPCPWKFPTSSSFAAGNVEIWGLPKWQNISDFRCKRFYSRQDCQPCHDDKFQKQANTYIYIYIIHIYIYIYIHIIYQQLGFSISTHLEASCWMVHCIFVSEQLYDSWHPLRDCSQASSALSSSSRVQWVRWVGSLKSKLSQC